MLTIATDLNSNASIKGTIIARQDTAHGSEVVTIRPLGDDIPVRVDTLHYRVEEVHAFIA